MDVALAAHQKGVAEVVGMPDGLHRPALFVAKALDLPAHGLDLPRVGVVGVIARDVGRVVADLVIGPVHALAHHELGRAHISVGLGEQVHVAVLGEVDPAAVDLHAVLGKRESSHACALSGRSSRHCLRPGVGHTD